ncbi:MAG TPA: hypothetical protein VG435_14285 [Acidimicrobiales bacterium]|jgi:hypothetical protein|nr:hypothetical protein [Acidimicrobiales bacterium]
MTVTLTACSGHRDTTAINAAKSACADLVSVGQALSGASASNGVQGSSIAHSLEQSKGSADEAARLDAAHYKVFAQNIDSFVDAIESGKGVSQAQDTTLSAQCKGYN